MIEYTVEAAAERIAGRTSEQVIRDAAAAIKSGEADPASLEPLILALAARYERKAERRAARATVAEQEGGLS